MKGSFIISGSASVRSLATLIVLSFFLGGCSLFFGNVKPIDEKSSSYHILDLSKESSEWKKLDSGIRNENSESGLSDMAYQSEKTASVISINSACKSYQSSEQAQKHAPEPTKHLKELTRELLLGFSDISLEEESPVTVANTPSWQTTLKGKLNQENVMIRTVVLQKSNCVYDLMYLSRPENFKASEKAFMQFVASLRLN